MSNKTAKIEIAMLVAVVVAVAVCGTRRVLRRHDCRGDGGAVGACRMAVCRH